VRGPISKSVYESNRQYWDRLIREEQREARDEIPQRFPVNRKRHATARRKPSSIRKALISRVMFAMHVIERGPIAPWIDGGVLAEATKWLPDAHKSLTPADLMVLDRLLGANNLTQSLARP
jgi:hypothetical protein